MLDSILRRLGAKRNVYDNKLLRAFRKISIPIPGYYIWELVCHNYEQGDLLTNYQSDPLAEEELIESALKV